MPTIDLSIFKDQMKLSRILFGFYLLIFFGLSFFDRNYLYNVKFLADLFSLKLSLIQIHSEWVVFVTLIVGIVSSLALIYGRLIAVSAAFCYFALCFISSINLALREIYYDYIGLLLLFYFLSNLGTGWENKTTTADDPVMNFAKKWIFFLMCLDFFISSSSKLFYEPWRTGEIISLVQSSIFPRFDWVFSSDSLSVNRALSYFVISLEFFPLFLIIFKPFRLLAWFCIVILKLGLLIFYNVPQISLFYLILLYFVFDKNWVDSSRHFIKKIDFRNYRTNRQLN